MKKFNEMFMEFGHELGSMDMASRLVASGFGIVPGGGWTQDSRVFADKKGGFSMSDPLYDMDAISVVLSRQSDSPYYLALGTLGESQLCVVDIDNCHHADNVLTFDEMWERFGMFAESLGCDESEIETLCIRTPGAGAHLLFTSDIAPLFGWLTAAQSDILGEGIAIDWLTPGSSQHETGPGCVRPQCSARCGGRYDVFVPSGSDASNLAALVKPLPTSLLRWLVEKQIADKHAHNRTVADCFRSPLGMKKALRDERVADVIKAGQKAERPKKKAGGAGSSRAISCDEVGLWKAQKPVNAGGRHNATTSFAGTCVKRCTGADFDATCDLIEAEIRNFAEHVCVPSLPVAEVASIVRDARGWAEDARAEIEQRIASRVTVVGADGVAQTQVLDDFCQRVVNGASYRCKRLKGGRASLPIASPRNVAEALEHDEGLAGCFGFDTFNNRNCIVKPLPWSTPDESFPRYVTDDDMGHIITYIDEVAGFDPTKNFRIAFNEVSARHGHAFDPLKDFVNGFDGLWDGQNHMDIIARYMGVGSDDIVDGQSFSEVCMTIMMRGAIRRALRPGCQFDYTLILAGEQGIGKSSFIRALACNPAWFCDNLADIGDSKRAFEQISGSWIVNIDELSAMRSQKDITLVKSYLTKCFDDYRAPYRQERQRVPRRCVFMATTNELSFLNDRSGNRRYLVVPCVGVMDERGLPAMFSDPSFDHEIEQAWAQAYAMEMSEPDAPLALPLWAMKEQAERNEGSSVADPIEEKLTSLFSERRLDDEPMSYAQVYAEVYDCSQSDYARERHLKSFQDLARRVAKRAGWSEGRFYAFWGEQKKSQKRGFMPVLTDAERASIRMRVEEQADDEIPVDLGSIPEQNSLI